MKAKRRDSKRPCESCNRMGGFPTLIEGLVFQMCDECAPSEFKRGRVVDRFMARAFIRAVEELIKCCVSQSASASA